MRRLLQFILAAAVGLAAAGHIAAGLWTGRIWAPDGGPRSAIAWSAHPSAYLITLVVLAIIFAGCSANILALLRERGRAAS
jgi:hypothetical protein